MKPHLSRCSMTYWYIFSCHQPQLGHEKAAKKTHIFQGIKTVGASWLPPIKNHVVIGDLNSNAMVGFLPSGYVKRSY